jgi:3-hydroxymyristoyl/3-hydroxydecanoyl-(acyl carrier protein) dehydratase
MVRELPHTYPFLLVDRVLMREPERWAVTLRSLTRNDPLMDDDGQLAPALVVEVMAQTAGLAIGAAKLGKPIVLARVDRFRCRPPFRAGDQLLVTARVVRRLGGSVKERAVVRVGNRWRAAGDLVLHGPPLPQGAGAGGP